MKRKLLVMLLAVPMFMVGCGGTEDKPKPSSQVAVKVNGEEVTVHQLNQVLSKVRVQVKSEESEAVRKKALESLIDQELIIQAAKNANMERTPEVLTAIEAAKRKVLVDFYMKRTLQSVDKPTLDEVQAFYQEQPQIFADRQLFIYTQVTVPLELSELDSLVKDIRELKDLRSIIAVLDDRQFKYKKVNDAKTSEKLPGPFLKPLNSLSVGDVGYLKMSDGLLIISLQQKIAQPIGFEEATPAIERQLYRQKQKEVAAKLISSLKESAMIEYVGDFKVKQSN